MTELQITQLVQAQLDLLNPKNPERWRSNMTRMIREANGKFPDEVIIRAATEASESTVQRYNGEVP